VPFVLVPVRIFMLFWAEVALHQRAAVSNNFWNVNILAFASQIQAL